MKDIAKLGIIAFLGYTIFRKNVPPTIPLPKAIVNVQKIR